MDKTGEGDTEAGWRKDASKEGDASEERGGPTKTVFFANRSNESEQLIFGSSR